MSPIYEPKGKARGYSPLALNFYNGCDHGCTYCFNKRFKYFTDNPVLKKNFFANLLKDAKKLAGTNKQVLLCFSGDPYCKKDVVLQATRRVLEILLLYKIPTAVLTKGGERCLRDLDLFKQFGEGIKIGASLTFSDPEHSKHYEPGAALPEERFQTLKTLHDAGIRTWVSLEPVINIKQTLAIIDITHPYVTEYKIGKLNGYRLEKNNPFGFNCNHNWKYFLNEAVSRMRMYNKQFYVKKELREFDKTLKLYPHEIDQDYLTVKSF